MCCMTVFPQDTFQWLHGLCRASSTIRQIKKEGGSNNLKTYALLWKWENLKLHSYAFIKTILYHDAFKKMFQNFKKSCFLEHLIKPPMLVVICCSFFSFLIFWLLRVATFYAMSAIARNVRSVRIQC